MPSLLQRFARIAPYFRHGRLGIVAAFVASLVGALTEPLIPELMKPLLDQGFTGGSLPLWLIPVAIVGVFAVRGVAGFVAQYALSWAAYQGVQSLREAMFLRILNAQPAMFSRQSASSLTNTLVYEVQGGAQQLVNSVLTLVKDSLTLLALLGYLMWLNWKLTLFVGVLFPAVAWVMRTAGRRLHRLAREGQDATDQLGYVVEENVLAWRVVRLHGAEPAQARRFDTHALTLRRVLLKIVAASGLMTPITQLITALALSAVICVALWQSQSTGTTVGGFVAFITAMLMLVAPIKHLSDVMAPITRGLASVERGLELLEQSPAEQSGNHRSHRARRRNRPARCGAALSRRRAAGARRRVAADRRRRDGGPGRALGRRQEHADQPSATLRRCPVGHGAPGRRAAGRLGHHPAAPPVRARQPGRGDVQRHGGRQRGPRRSGARPRAHPRRAAQRLSARLHRRPAAGHRHRAGPQRRPVVGRPAPAPGDCPRAVQGCASADPRRGHLGARQRKRARGAGGRWRR